MTYVRKRIVFDTSSLIPACLHPERTPAQVLRHAIRWHEVYASPIKLDELKVVLMREKFEQWQPRLIRLTWLANFEKSVRLVNPVEQIQACRDAKDNPFLESAVAANADMLIASDPHLLELHPFRDIAIVRLMTYQQACMGIDGAP